MTDSGKQECTAQRTGIASNFGVQEFLGRRISRLGIPAESKSTQDSERLQITPEQVK
jgi:hypothetical protein